jgi:hypothetical protein
MATYGTFVDDVSLKFSEVNDFFTAQTEPFPVLTQGVSVTYANDRLMAYYKVNKFVNGNFFFNVTGTGTLGSRIEVSLPVTAASSSVRLIGEALISDISALQYRVCRIVRISTTRMAFLTDSATSLTTYLGQTNGPNIRLASNDILLGSFRYEAA